MRGDAGGGRGGSPKGGSSKVLAVEPWQGRSEVAEARESRESCSSELDASPTAKDVVVDGLLLGGWAEVARPEERRGVGL